ncbi:MAG TPA: type I-D CRISPR-associated protein Cas7/Csc2 [Firmicutes bacterium]|nr:type I-D CRISPR-associated protein Cas7/Csc2 [Bacillota bacterium]
MSNIDEFNEVLASVQTLTPREVKGKIIAQAIYTRQVVTVVGVKTATSRFLPVSHAGYSNETYVDKLDLLGKTRAEFIGRKLKGIERRAHMTLFRQMVEAETKGDWEGFFRERFDSACTIPDKLCLACWNCSLFGGMESQVKKAGTFSRVRYFDTFSVEDAAECVQTDDSPEQMAIGNVVYEDLVREGEAKTRGAESFHRYEYVKAGTRFPFITIIESPTLLDVAGYLAAIKLADQHGYGKYSANHGKFKTKFLAVSTGYPLFSVLDMLTWLEKDDPNNLQDKLKFEAPVGQLVSLFSGDIEAVQEKLKEEFKTYIVALGAKPKDGRAKSKGKKGE